MKRTAGIVLAAFIIAGCDSAGTTESTLRTPLVIAHRGASAVAPEHTIAAYDKAVEMGADYLELDVQRSVDGALVVVHDVTLDRTARGTASDCIGLVAQKTLAQLERCDVGSWFNETNPSLAQAAFVGLRIPTLEGILVRYASSAHFYIETKNPDLYPGIESDLVALLAKHGISAGPVWPPRVFIESFSASSLMTIHSLDSSLPLVQLFGATGAQAVVAQLGQVRLYAAAIGPIDGDVTPSVVGAAHSRCLQLHAYVVDDPAEMLLLLAMGVDGIFTDRPDVLRQKIEQSDAHIAGDTGCTAALR